MSSNSTSLLNNLTNNSTTTTLNDGSGIYPFRTSPSFLLFAIQSIIIGLFLLLLGKRGWRVTSGLALFLTFEFLTWVTIINTLRDEGFNGNYSSNTNALIIWGVVTIFGLLASFIGVVFPRVVIFMGGLGGAALAFSIVLMADNDISVAPRWIVIGVLTLVGFAVVPLTKHGIALATALAGAFLLFFGIDLLINQVGGMSLGMRYLFDKKASHQSTLIGYSPPISTRVLLALIWIFAAISTIFQSYWYSAPFDRNLTDVDNLDLDSVDGMTEMTGHDTIASKIQRRYEMAAEERAVGHNSPNGSMNKPILVNHPQEMSDPNEPNSRPSSIVSTSLANGLRSRPPTFFNEPLGESTPLPEFHNFPSTTTDFRSFAIPIAAVSGVGIIEEESSHIKRHSEDDDIYGLHPTASNHSHVTEDRDVTQFGTKRDSDGSVQSSLASRKSYRKPVPIDQHNQQLQQHYQAQHAEFENGLLSGRNFTLSPSIAPDSASIAPSNYSDTTAGIMAGFSSGTVLDRRLSDDRVRNHSTTSTNNHSVSGHIETYEEGERSPAAESFRTAASNFQQ